MRDGAGAGRWLRRLVLWTLPMLVGACGGQGCTSCSAQPPKPQVPGPLMLPGAARVRVTQQGFDVIAGEMMALTKLLFGTNAAGKAKIDVGKLIGPAQMTIGGGLGIFKGTASVRDLVLTLDMDALKIHLIEGSEPARIRLLIDHADLGVEQGVIAGGVSFLGMKSDAACHLLDGVDVGTADQRLATVSASIDLVLGVDAKGALQVSVVVGNPVLHDVGFDLAKDCGLKECQDKLLAEDPCLECGICAAGSITSDAIAGLKAFLEPVLGTLMEGVANLLLKKILADGINGKPLDVEVPLDLKALLSAASPELGALLGPADPLRVRLRPAPAAFAVQSAALRSRFDLGMWARARGCVGVVGADDTGVFAKLAQGPPPELPASMKVYGPGGEAKVVGLDVGALIARSALEEGLWAILRSGLLCIAVDSDRLYHLSGGRLLLPAGLMDLLLPGLRQIAPVDAPMRIALAPSADPKQAPALELADDGLGGARVRARVTDLQLRIEVQTHDRWLTVVELRATAVAEIGARIDTQGRLLLAVGDVSLPEVQVASSALFADSGIEEIVPAIADAAVAMLLAQPLAFDMDLKTMISQAIALPISVELLGMQVQGGAQDWLLVGAALAPAKEGAP